MLKLKQNIFFTALCLFLVLALFEDSSVLVESKRLSKLNKNDNDKQFFNYEDETDNKVESVADPSESDNDNDNDSNDHESTNGESHDKKSELLDQESDNEKKSELLENEEKDDPEDVNPKENNVDTVKIQHNDSDNDIQSNSSSSTPTFNSNADEIVEVIETGEPTNETDDDIQDENEDEANDDDGDDEDIDDKDQDEDDGDGDDKNQSKESTDTNASEENDHKNVQKPSNIKENSHIHHTSEKTEKVDHSNQSKNKFNLLYIVLPGAGLALLLLALAGFIIVKKTNLFKKRGPTGSNLSNKQHPRSNNTVYQPVTQQV